jgi:putative heme iron utilization protein
VDERPDPTLRPIPDRELRAVATLIRGQRWASLSTTDEDGFPLGSMVAYVPMKAFAGFTVHISKLARHTRNLLSSNLAALTIGEPDVGEGDPQTLARVSIQGHAVALARDSTDYVAAKALYLEHLPDAAQLFGFADFVMFRFVPRRAHYVGGFARAYGFDADKLVRAAGL